MGFLSGGGLFSGKIGILRASGASLRFPVSFHLPWRSLQCSCAPPRPLWPSTAGVEWPFHLRKATMPHSRILWLTDFSILPIWPANSRLISPSSCPSSRDMLRLTHPPLSTHSGSGSVPTLLGRVRCSPRPRTSLFALTQNCATFSLHPTALHRATFALAFLAAAGWAAGLCLCVWESALASFHSYPSPRNHFPRFSPTHSALSSLTRSIIFNR